MDQITRALSWGDFSVHSLLVFLIVAALTAIGFWVAGMALSLAAGRLDSGVVAEERAIDRARAQL